MCSHGSGDWHQLSPRAALASVLISRLLPPSGYSSEKSLHHRYQSKLLWEGGKKRKACVLSVSVGLSLACLGHTTAGGHELSWHGGAPCSFTAPSSQLSKSSDSTGHGSPQACHLLMSTADEFSLSLLSILWNFLSFIPEAT